MAKFQVYNLGSLNLKISPMLQKPGDLLRSVNVESYPFGAKRKRSGYTTYLGTMPNGSVVQDLAHWTRTNGTQMWNYAFAGGLLYYSTQGTGAWTICGNGTWNPGGTLTTAIGWDNGTVGTTDVMMVADSIGTVRHSADGTSFTDTASAPAAAVALANYSTRIYAAGTNSFIFWSNSGTITDWVNDSFNLVIPGPGKPLSMFTNNNRLVITKNSGHIFRYDRFELADLTTDLGPTSSRSLSDLEESTIYLNRKGFYSYSGNSPQLISNSIERQIYNSAETGIVGTTFDSAPGIAHNYKYYSTIGTTSDDLSSGTVKDAVAVYDYQLNEWSNYSYANKPTSYLSYTDAVGSAQLIFGGGSQVYQMSGTATSDNGTPIEAVLEGVLSFGNPETEKKFNYLWAFFNPGCEAQVQIAIGDTYTSEKKNWIDLGDTVNGVAEYKFSPGSRGRLLFWKVKENSATARFIFYGFTVDLDNIERN